MPKKILSFVARSGTGKTTLLEKLIAELQRRGRKVGAIKHTVHEVELDKPGKDSHRFLAAGARAAIVASAGEIACFERRAAETPLEELAARLPDDLEIVIAEGFKHGSSAKIELHRTAQGDALLCRGEADDPTLVAVVSDAPLPLDVPVLPLDDVGAVADFVEAWFKGGPSKRRVADSDRRDL